jgi:hypothetical protein
MLLRIKLLMGSVSLYRKVIPLSGAHCTISPKYQAVEPMVLNLGETTLYEIPQYVQTIK